MNSTLLNRAFKKGYLEAVFKKLLNQAKSGIGGFFEKTLNGVAFLLPQRVNSGQNFLPYIFHDVSVP